MLLSHLELDLEHLKTNMRPVVVVHGGAWAIPDELSRASVDGVKAAARAGYAVLEKGASALDAVEAAVRSLEDNPAFDAGEGCWIRLTCLHSIRCT